MKSLAKRIAANAHRRTEFAHAARCRGLDERTGVLVDVAAEVVLRLFGEPILEAISDDAWSSLMRHVNAGELDRTLTRLIQAKAKEASCPT